ncbi:MAG: RNA polymerase sigma factor [Candidatus Kapaibacterium sp.]
MEQRPAVSDVDLFARHLRGDHDALMTLFDRHNERLWLYVARIISDGSIAHDIMQDLWERVIYLRKKKTEAPDNPVGYCYRMARNLSLNFMRSRKGDVQIDDLTEADHPTVEIAEPTDQEELLTLALEKLPEAYREVLVLNAWSGYSFDEIAEMLGKQPGAIHTTAYRARKRLAEIMEAMSGEEGKDQP